MQNITNNGTVIGQHNIQHNHGPQMNISADLRETLRTLEGMIEAGAVEPAPGMQAARELRESLEEAGEQPTGRLRAAATRARELLASGGAAADDVSKVSTVIAAIGTFLGG